jgi:hypothetical protein
MGKFVGIVMLSIETPNSEDGSRPATAAPRRQAG